jgi:hypothetical protein
MAFTNTEKNRYGNFCQFLTYASKFYCQEPFETGICRWLKYLWNYMNHPVCNKQRNPAVSDCSQPWISVFCTYLAGISNAGDKNFLCKIACRTKDNTRQYEFGILQQVRELLWFIKTQNIHPNIKFCYNRVLCLLMYARKKVVIESVLEMSVWLNWTNNCQIMFKKQKKTWQR